MYIAVEGLIGAGKTTLASSIASCSGGRLFSEPVRENPFLPRFYSGEPGSALAMQLYFLLARYEQQLEIRTLGHCRRMLVSDYSFEKELVFAPVLLRAERERELHKATYASLVARVRRPDLVVFIRTPIDQCLKRIRLRNRKMERGIDAPYLTKLDVSYKKWLEGYDGRVMELDVPYFRSVTDDAERFARELVRELR